MSSPTIPLTCYYDARGLQIGATDADNRFFVACPGGSAFVPGARRVSLPLDWEQAAYRALGPDWPTRHAAEFTPVAAKLLRSGGISVTT